MVIGGHTGGIGQLILSALDLVLQTLSFAPGSSDLSLHLFTAHVGHCVGRVPRGDNNGDVGGQKIREVEGGTGGGSMGGAKK